MRALRKAFDLRLRAKVNLKRAGPRVTGGAGKTDDAEAERSAGCVEDHGRLKGVGAGKARAVMSDGAFEQQGGQRIVVIVFEAAPVLRAAFFEGIADVVDAVLQIVIVFQKAPVEEGKVRDGKAQDVVRGFCAAFGDLQENGVGDGCADGIAGGIPTGVGGHRMDRRFGFEQQRQQRLIGVEMLGEVREGDALPAVQKSGDFPGGGFPLRPQIFSSAVSCSVAPIYGRTRSGVEASLYRNAMRGAKPSRAASSAAKMDRASSSAPWTRNTRSSPILFFASVSES